VHIFPVLSMARAARILLIPLIAIVLLAPITICNLVGSLTARLVVIIIATISFVGAMSSLTTARIVELVVAAAT